MLSARVDSERCQSRIEGCGLKKAREKVQTAFDRIKASRAAEPDAAQLEFTLRRLSSSTLASSQQWPDAYLASFANTSALTLVTFDRALSRSAPGTVLLLS